MCSVCWQIPCHPRCPNAPEPEPVKECSVCGDGIFAGDKFYDGPDGAICESCIEDLSVRDFIELIGESLSEAEEKEE